MQSTNRRGFVELVPVVRSHVLRELWQTFFSFLVFTFRVGFSYQLYYLYIDDLIGGSSLNSYGLQCSGKYGRRFFCSFRVGFFVPIVQCVSYGMAVSVR